ncbi:MAG: FadR family transcriptional regulator [Magnetovibrio sp.]|nr:FadR family transcriptional regulator [Magnetovibrio sp.]
MTNPNHKKLNPALSTKTKKKIGQGTYSERSLHGQVVHELGRRIVSGAIAEGAILPIETDLGTEFDVSRTALREGIKVLTAKGLLVSRTRTGTRVRPRSDWNMLDPDVLAWRLETRHDLDFVQDLYDFRMAIEPMAASLAAIRATDEELALMSEAFADMLKAKNDIHAFLEPDMRFHLLILSSCRNEFLSSLYALIETALKFSFDLVELEVQIDLADIHRPILEALKARDARGAHDAMVNHLKCSHDLNEAVLAQIVAENK